MQSGDESLFATTVHWRTEQASSGGKENCGDRLRLTTDRPSRTKAEGQQDQQGGESSVSDNPMFLYAGEYDDVDDAKADLEELKELHGEPRRASRRHL